MRLLGLDEAAAEAAEAHGAITLGAEIQFRHPLMRSVVYGDASPPQRRRAHAALADVLGANGSRVRAAWHRALAATRADATLADELAEAADELRARGAYSAAAGFGEHAARLTPARELRARRLTSTASDAQVAGLGGHAEALLDQALELTADPLVRSDAQGLRARGLLFTGRPLDALALLLDEADRIEPLDRARAALLLAQAIPVCSMAGVIDRGLEVGQRAVELAADADDGLRTIAELARSQTLQLAGDAEGARRLRENVRRRPHLDDPRALLELNQVEAGHLMVVGDHGAAKASIDHLIALARAAAAPALMPFALATRSEINLRTGHWVEAIADATEAVELARQTGQPAHAAYAAMIHARLLSARGLAAESAAALDEAEHIGRVGGIGALRFYVPAARAFDALGRGDLEGAVGFGLEVDWISRERGLGEPGVVLWPPDLVEALAWLERRDEAGRVLERFETQAEATGRVWALATAARCRGLLAGEGHYETRFAEAIEHHERLDMPFERARTDLCLGERRAAFGRAREAVAPLRRALAVFERLGAHPWTARTAVALASVGARVDRAEPPVVDLLTEHELRVALALASGASTSDTATQLFLGPRTVEAHARAVYEKLGVSTPDEVGRRLKAVERVG
jgi:ATP/maltotriose-dependent transcriptional regulator MalT